MGDKEESMRNVSSCSRNKGVDRRAGIAFAEWIELQPNAQQGNLFWDMSEFTP